MEILINLQENEWANIANILNGIQSNQACHASHEYDMLYLFVCYHYFKNSGTI